MFLLYLDDAGSPDNETEDTFVLGGICLFERQISWLTSKLDDVANRTGHPEPETLELHGSHILNGKNFWKRLSRQDRRSVIRQGLATVRDIRGEWAAFASVVNKHARSPEDPQDYAFEQILNRFDRFLGRRYKNGKNDKGIIIMDNNKSPYRLRQLARDFRTTGHRWGALYNISEVPMFVDSKATRAIQLADLIAYSIWRKMERNDAEFFDVISKDFERSGGAIHGFHHDTFNYVECDCPSCDPSKYL